MHEKPREIKESILTLKTAVSSILQGLFIFLVVFITYFVLIYNHFNISLSVTVSYSVLVLSIMLITYQLRSTEFTIKAFRPIEEAIVTSGGVNIKEINPKTMESKIINGLYFAGEIIDVDSYTGGFNLQIAYSTGYTAGKE